MVCMPANRTRIPHHAPMLCCWLRRPGFNKSLFDVGYSRIIGHIIARMYTLSVKVDAQLTTAMAYLCLCACVMRDAAIPSSSYAPMCPCASLRSGHHTSTRLPCVPFLHGRRVSLPGTSLAHTRTHGHTPPPPPHTHTPIKTRPPGVRVWQCLRGQVRCACAYVRMRVMRMCVPSIGACA